jgi:Mlc titration factor MtfA (ptsG expression regulator)
VIHEFAHHIDGLDGEMGGMPNIASPELRERWKTVFDRDFQNLVSDIHHDRPTLIDPYAGTNRAEFFAVTSELFFDSPEFLRQQLPDIYECLAAFYQLDPLLYAQARRHLH